MQPDILRRVVNAKFVLQRAASFLTDANEMSLSISLLLMHDSIELLMLAVLDHLKIPIAKKREFMDFWPDIKQAGHREPPDRIPMESLNKVRVGLKHNGIFPNPTQVRELFPRAIGFFENILKSYCDISYDEVSLIDLIPDQEVRTLLTDARKKFLNGEKDSAMVDLQIALHKLQEPDGKYLPRIVAPKAPRIPSEMQRAGWGTYLDQLHSFLEQTATATNSLRFGIDPVRYADFVGIGPNILWSFTGTPNVLMRRTYSDISIERFDELVAFLIDYALKVSDGYVARQARRIPQTRGSIEMPEPQGAGF